MTDARLSQLPVEVLRTNLAVDAQVSQVAVEVLRPNSAKRFVASVGSYTLTGKTSNGVYTHVLSVAAGTFTATGVAATFTRGLKVAAAKGTFTLTGAAASYARSNMVIADSGAVTLTVRAASLEVRHKFIANRGIFALSGIATSFKPNKIYETISDGPSVVASLATQQTTFPVMSEAAIIYQPNTGMARLTWYPIISSAFRTASAIAGSWKVTTVDNASWSDTNSYTFSRGAVVSEFVKILESQGVQWLFISALRDGVSLADLLGVSYPSSVSETITLSDVIIAVRGIAILEALRLGDPTTPAVKYHTDLADAILSSDALYRFVGGELADTLNISESLTNQPRFRKILNEIFNLTDSASRALVLRVTAPETFALDDLSLAQMLYHPVLADGLDIVAGYVSPNGTITTWAINTSTGAVTEYGNYAFNSFGSLGHKYLGTSRSGLYELDGDDDAGTDVIARIKSGYSQFGGSRYSSFKAAYLGMRANGNIILKLDTGDGKSYTYETVAQDMQSTKVRLGKGLRARYFSFELISTGQDFDLDTVELLPLVAQRRV